MTSAMNSDPTAVARPTESSCHDLEFEWPADAQATSGSPSRHIPASDVDSVLRPRRKSRSFGPELGERIMQFRIELGVNPPLL